jgi:hypothetical protein
MIAHSRIHDNLRRITLISSTLSAIFLIASITIYNSIVNATNDKPGAYINYYRQDPFFDTLCFLPIGLSVIWCPIYLFFLSRSKTRTSVINARTTPQLASGSNDIVTTKSRHTQRALSPVTSVVVDLLIWLAFLIIGPSLAFWIGLAATWGLYRRCPQYLYKYDDGEAVVSNVLEPICTKLFTSVAALEIVAFFFMGVSL